MFLSYVCKCVCVCVCVVNVCYLLIINGISHQTHFVCHGSGLNCPHKLTERYLMSQDNTKIRIFDKYAYIFLKYRTRQIKAAVAIKISNLLTCFCSFELSCPILEKDTLIENLCIVLFCLIK